MLHRHFPSHSFSLNACALQKRRLYSRLPRLSPFYCTTTAWDPQFVYTLNILKDVSLGSGAAGHIFYVSILAFARLVGNNMSLREDPAAGVGVRSGTTLAALGLRQGRKGWGDLATVLFVCLRVHGED